MKIIINLNKNDYVTLPSGETINAGGTMEVLNDAILEAQKLKKMIENHEIKIEEIKDNS